jgi:Arc/MetJ family transcription regulator
MPTNLAIDDKLIAEALEIGHHKTKKEAVTTALREYIQRRKQLRILELKGKIHYEPDYDYKALRRQKAAVGR